ncbi:MAG: class I SAM-dependent methyltransferase [Nitrospiraceae bacterium]|nr:MAG: class I SAM-dependent methyltransferase [Nitrospiraceae bacterium]
MIQNNLLLKKNMESTEASWDRVWGVYGKTKYEFQLALEEHRVRWQKIHDIVIERYGSFRGLNCIEIGAGSGHYSMLFARQGAHVTLLDYSKEALKFCQAIFRDNCIREEQARFVHMDALRIDPAFLGKYDVSMSFGVAEHFEGKDRTGIVKAHYDVLNQAGVTFISVPNAHCIPYRIYQFIAGFKKRDTIECHAYSKGEFKHIAGENNINKYEFIGSSYIDAYSPLSFYRRKRGLTGDIAKINNESPSRLDKYLGREITFIGKK